MINNVDPSYSRASKKEMLKLLYTINVSIIMKRENLTLMLSPAL
jgi:hypothetical protein